MKYFALLYLLFLNSFAFAQKQDERLRIANEMENSIKTQLLNKSATSWS